MAYEKGESIKVAEATLKNAGFTVSQICCSRPSCFDFAARKNHDLIFIKVHPDIDSLSPHDSEELGAITESVSGAPLLISKKARDKPLEDDTVYSRYDTYAVTQRTFENIMLHKVAPLIQAGPGGYYVEIDCETVKQRRQELGLSVGELAKLVGISRRTLYGYERGMGKASVAAAYNMIYTLGVPVARPVNVLEKTGKRHKCYILATAKRVIVRNKLINRLFRKFGNHNMTTVKKAPFDFIAAFPEEKARIIGGVVVGDELELDRRIDEILSISRLIEAYPILITDGPKPTDKDILCLRTEEIARIKQPADLLLNVM
jgi:putative transcriptional regulator